MQNTYNNTIELNLLESWFSHRVIKPPSANKRQTIAGWLGVLNGACSSTVNFPLGFAFGYNFAKNLHSSDFIALFIAAYFGITATIPLLFLASYTSYRVLHNIFMPLLPIERIWQRSRASYLFEASLWCLALFSALPFLYVTHVNLYPLIKQWVYLFDFSAITAPTIVNSWALRSAGKELRNLAEILYIRLKKSNLDNFLVMKHYLRRNFLIAIQSIERIQKPHMMSIYSKIYSNLFNGTDKQNHLLEYILALTQSRYNQVPKLKTTFGCLGAMIGAIAALQYLNNGKAAADWLHFPQLGNIIGVASLICNGALGGYTGKVVFEEFYNWLGFIREWLTNDQEPAIAPASRNPWQTPITWLKDSAILLVAISAATPNVYLTLLQQANYHSLFNIIWLICSFIGPLATNIYAISSTLKQNDKRTRLKNIIVQLLDTISQLPNVYTKAFYHQLIKIKSNGSALC